MKTSPLFYWPTTLMMVSDDRTFSKNFTTHFQRLQPTLCYQNLAMALDILHTATDLSMMQSCLVAPIAPSEVDLDFVAKTMDYRRLPQLAFNQNRFAKISAVLVDSIMPHMNGVEFCRKIVDLPIKKIMLMDKLESDAPVNALNEGIIDAFIVKDSNHILDELNKIILRMQFKYFSDISLSLMGSHLNDYQATDDYARLLNDFISDYRIVEYYQLDSLGSCLGLDKQGKPYWLVIRTEEEFAQELDTGTVHRASSSALNKLIARTHLLFLFSEVEKKRHVSDWGHFLFPIMQSFERRGKLYYCSVIKHEQFSLSDQKIMSFQHYLKQRSPLPSVGR